MRNLSFEYIVLNIDLEQVSPEATQVRMTRTGRIEFDRGIQQHPETSLPHGATHYAFGAEQGDVHRSDWFDLDEIRPLTKRFTPGYSDLRRILDAAFEQAASGKGKERHANGLPFNEQPMQDLIRAHGVGFATGQAAKKLQESHGLQKDAAIRELLGAIVYTAGAILSLED